jgi:sec-independent protein translocase protein TatA
MAAIFWTPGPIEIILVFLIALLLFGKRLPDVARSLGKGISEFKKGVKDIEEDVDKAGNIQGDSRRDENKPIDEA